MKNKRLVSVAVAFVLVVSCCFSAFALSPLGIGDLIDIITSVDNSKYTQFNEQEWNTMTSSERAQQINYVISDQKGTSYISDDCDFINDSSSSYQAYNILTNNSGIFGASTSLNVAAKQKLEQDGLADFGMGYYNSNGHSSGKFGDGTVADTLNDEFLNHLQNNSLPTTPFHRLTSGDYVIEYGAEWTSDRSVRAYAKVLYKGDVIDNYTFYSYSSTSPLNAYDKAKYTDIYNTWNSSIFYNYDTNTVILPSSSYTSRTYSYKVPSYITSPVETDNDIPVIGVDDNGNQIDLKINSDGVTYEGNTYNYNNDNTVTIGDKTYYIAVQPNKVDDDYYKQFLNDTINNYYNYYTTNSSPFDGTDILTSLRSIFSSLETFRSYCYSQLKQIYDTVHSGFNNMRSSLKTLGNKLDEIIKQLKNINKQLDNITEEQKEQNKLNWLSLILKFQNKIGYSSLVESMGNISSGFFGVRTFTVNESGGINVSIASDNGSSIPSSMPSLSVEYLGNKYDLYTCLGSLEGISTIKSFISLFLWAGFLISLFRSIPSIIGGVASVQDHSNNVVIDKNTGEVKWGA